MAQIYPGRYTTGNEHDVVLFRIGMRFNGVRGVATALRVFLRMPAMLAELARDESLGLLASRVALSWPVVEITQYWRSIDDLQRYAALAERAHLPAWAWFNRLGNAGRGAGIWHETYHLRPGTYETVYVNMPRFGLALATGHHPVGSHEARAQDRLNARAPR